jgi:hypothetical protein
MIVKKADTEKVKVVKEVTDTSIVLVLAVKSHSR